MQPNKQRQRRIRNVLHKSFPKEGSAEFALCDRNQRLSPFLRLPPELRNRIYQLVLDVGQINVCFKRWKHRLRTPTRNGPRCYDTIEGGFYCRILDKDHNPWRGLVGPSLNAPPRGMTLLSPVCRQLYHETMLLPFRLNAWSFESLHVLERFIVKEKRLPLPQRRAIRLLYTPTLPTAVEKYLCGLEMVVLETGFAMVKQTGLDSGHRTSTVAWHVSHRKWK